MDNPTLIATWKDLNTRPRLRFHEREWCAYGYAQHPGLFRQAAEDTYEFRFTCSPASQSLLAEGQAAAHSLVSAFDGEPLLLMLSGGLDSEFMVRCFLDVKAKFKVGIIRHARGANAHDIVPALRLANSLGLDYQFFDLDTLDMLKSETAWEYARVTQCKHLGYVPWCLAISQWSTDFICISGFNEPEVLWSPDVQAQATGDYRKGTWVFADHERFPSFQRFLTFSANARVIPSFYQWRQELWAAFITHPLVRRLAAGLYNRRIFTTEALKYQMYGLDQRVKFTGYERILTQLFLASEALRLSMPFPCWSSYDIPYDQVIDQLGVTQ